MLLLDEICNSSVYHKNAYYLLGIQVGMTGRKLKHRIEDLQGAGEMGVADWNRAYDKFLLGSVEAPNRELFDELSDKIKDPEFAISEAFFWFWPINEFNDPALDAISKGDREKAFNFWRGISTKSTKEGAVAKHNLAVLFHFYAIDAENERLDGKARTDTDEYLSVLDKFWRTAFGYWEDLVDDEDFWEAFTDRVKALDDPRLDEDFIEEFRVQFPISFDNINADYLVNYARTGKLVDAKRHFVYMTETMSGADDVDETLSAAFKPQIKKVHLQIRNCQESKIEENGLKDAKAVLDCSRELFNVFRFLLPPSNQMRRDLMNDVAKTCHDRLPPYTRKTDDFEGALLLEKSLLELASTSSLKNSITEAISILDKIVKEKQEEDTCWYCKKYKKDTPKKTVKMYGNLAPDFEKYGRVSYSTCQIQVPVCSSCSHRFSNNTVKSFPPIKQRLDAGWKFGEQPSQAEVNAVWDNISSALSDVFRRRGLL